VISDRITPRRPAEIDSLATSIVDHLGDSGLASFFREEIDASHFFAEGTDVEVALNTAYLPLLRGAQRGLSYWIHRP
jgi:hypothetical protein